MSFWGWLRGRQVSFGRRSEIDAAGYLRSLGYRVVASNYRTRTGEIDLVAREGDLLVFVEVKARRSSDPPEDAVNFRKQRRVIRAARSYIRRYRLQEVTYRFDVVAVTVDEDGAVAFRLLRDAFRDHND